MYRHITLMLVGCSGPVPQKDAQTPATDSGAPPDDTGHVTDDDSGLDSTEPETGDSGLTEDFGWPFTREVICYTAVADHYSGAPEIWRIRLDTGTIVEAFELTGVLEDVTSISSLGKEGDTLFACDWAETKLNTYDLASRTVSHEATRCIAAARWVGESPSAGGIVTLNSSRGHVNFYADLDAATRNSGDVLFDYATNSYSRITIADDTLYGAWHSTGVFEVVDLGTGESDTVPLQGYSDWVAGLAVVDGVLIVLDYDNQMHAFNAATGAWLGNLRVEHDGPSQYIYGLTCEASDTSG